MKPGGFYVHKEFLDVMIEVLKMQDTQVEVLWWNRGYTGNPWLIDHRPQTLKIAKRDLKDWRLYDAN